MTPMTPLESSPSSPVSPQDEEVPKLALETSTYTRFEWINNAFGQRLRQWEDHTVRRLAQSVYGITALEIGWPLAWTQNNSVSGCLFRDARMASYAPDVSVKNVAVMFEPAALPFQSRSIDVVVALHVLDMHDGQHPDEGPEAILREINRVLTADGHLILTLMNPHGTVRWPLLSRWLLPHLANDWHRLHPQRVAEWLELLGLYVVEACYGVYCPPIENIPYPRLSQKLSINWDKQWQRLDKIGNRWWPTAGAVYALKVQKRTLSATMVSRRRQLARQIKPVLQPATASMINSKKTMGLSIPPDTH